MSAFVVQGDLKLVGAQAVRAQVTATAAETRKLKTAAAEVGTGARTGAQGLQQLGREADGAAARIREATAASAMAEAQNAALARSNAVAAGSVGNLTAQFNDIFTMLAAGQNPLQLAIQQGTQITQVLGGSGAAGAAGALKNAFLGMISPVSLITLGSIAAGAAMVQWLMSAGDEAVSAEEALSSLKDSLGEVKDLTDLLSEADFSGLRSQYGEVNAELVEMLRLQSELSMLGAIQASANAMTAIVESFDGWFSDSLQGIASAFEVSIPQARLLEARMQAVATAATPEEALAAIVQLRAEIENTAGPMNTLSGAALETGINLLQAEAALRETVFQSDRLAEGLAAAEAQASGAADVVSQLNVWISEATGAASGFVAGLSEGADAGRALNIEGAQIGGWLGNAIGLAASFAGQMWAAANATAAAAQAQAQINAMKIEFSPGGQAMNRYGGRGTVSDRPVSWGDGTAVNPVRPGGGRGGGGGGGGGGGAAAREETDAIERLIEKREQELALLRETDPVQREMLRNRELLATATDAQRQKIDEVTAALEREKAMQEASQFFEESAADWLKSVVTGSDSASEALDKLIQRLIDAGIEALLLGKGPLAGLFGVSGGIFDGLFGGKGGGGLLSGLFGGGKADGGPIYGRGGPRDDQVLIAASPGEFMVNARATARNRAMLEYINGGGDIGRFANGGAIGGGGGSGAVPGQIVISMPITVDARGATEGSAALIEAAIARRTPDIVQKAVAAVSRERARGRAA